LPALVAVSAKIVDEAINGLTIGVLLLEGLWAMSEGETSEREFET
jgi:hypothetical protein